MIRVDWKVVTSAECKAQLIVEEAAHWIQKAVSLDRQSCLVLASFALRVRLYLLYSNRAYRAFSYAPYVRWELKWLMLKLQVPTRRLPSLPGSQSSPPYCRVTVGDAPSTPPKQNQILSTLKWKYQMAMCPILNYHQTLQQSTSPSSQRKWNGRLSTVRDVRLSLLGLTSTTTQEQWNRQGNRR